MSKWVMKASTFALVYSIATPLEPLIDVVEKLENQDLVPMESDVYCHRLFAKAAWIWLNHVITKCIFETYLHMTKDYIKLSQK